jgi:hypothetical protein
VHGEDQDGQFGVQGLQSADDLQAIQSGHGYIDDGHIRCGFLNQLNGFATIIGFSHYLHFTAFFDNAAQTGTDNAVVVCEEDLDQFYLLIRGTGNLKHSVINQEEIEYFRLNIEYLRSACGGSIIKKPVIKMTERSDIHKYSICILQSSIYFSSRLAQFGSLPQMFSALPV